MSAVVVHGGGGVQWCGRMCPTLGGMSVVKINAITVEEGAGPLLEERFAARAHLVESCPGFEGFRLLRPVSGDDRYFVVTQWADEKSFAQWRDGAARTAHSPTGKKAAVKAELLEFDVVVESLPADN